MTKTFLRQRISIVLTSEQRKDDKDLNEREDFSAHEVEQTLRRIQTVTID